MEPLLLFCKTYRDDMLRTRRLVASIHRFNTDYLPVCLAVPESDLARFRDCFGELPCSFITDEEILAATCAVYGDPPAMFQKHLYQQLIKLEFWRMNLCRNYLWLDSDSYFIKPFSAADFLHSSGVPYLVQNDGSDLLDFARRTGKNKIIADYHETRKNIKQLFQRVGPDYDFGPSPVVWSVEVLADMYSGYLRPRSETIFSLLASFPCEILIYGEFVHKRKMIPIYPVEPFFKVYHYAEQFFEDEMQGVTKEDLAEKFYGIVVQSNWAKLPGKKRPWPQRVRSEMRRVIRRFT